MRRARRHRHDTGGTASLFEIHRVQPLAPRAKQLRHAAKPLEIPEIDEHPAAAAERGRAPARSCARCRRDSGARNEPASASASIAPLPGRVGTSDTTDAPQAKAASTERSSHASCSSAGTNGGEISRKTRRRRRDRASARAARVKPSSVNRLFNRSSASGCAVSSPIATSSCGAVRAIAVTRRARRASDRRAARRARDAIRRSRATGRRARRRRPS